MTGEARDLACVCVDMTVTPGEHLSLWMRDPEARHCWMRVVKGGDPNKVQDRRVYVEKSPRVFDPSSGATPGDDYSAYMHPRHGRIWRGAEGNQLSGPPWVYGGKGNADNGDGPDLDSRRWADEKARELGYVLPDMQAEVARLKADWYSDGGWDLEDSEGFEEHREELLAYRQQVEGARAKRRAEEHEAAIEDLMLPALNSLPEHDPRGALTRGDAARAEHAANRLLRAVAEMLLPIVQRLDRLDERQEAELRKLEDHVDKHVRRLDGRD